MFRNLLKPDSGLMIMLTQVTDSIFLSLFFAYAWMWPEQQVLLRKLEQAAARYRRLEVVLTGAHRLPLYAPVVPKDGVPDSAGFRIFQREITGTARQVQTRLVLCCQPKLEAMYYVAE